MRNPAPNGERSFPNQRNFCNLQQLWAVSCSYATWLMLPRAYMFTRQTEKRKRKLFFPVPAMPQDLPVRTATSLHFTVSTPLMYLLVSTGTTLRKVNRNCTVVRKSLLMQISLKRGRNFMQVKTARESQCLSFRKKG